jgi:hypothetical protein
MTIAVPAAGDTVGLDATGRDTTVPAAGGGDIRPW